MEPLSVCIVLPGLPRGKGRPRFSSRGGFARAYTDQQTESYEGALRLAASQAMSGEAPLDGPLVLAMVAVFPVPMSWSKKKRTEALAGGLRPTGKPDCDNLLKTIDSCNGIVWHDDAQIVTAMVCKKYGEQPSMEIQVHTVTQ